MHGTQWNSIPFAYCTGPGQAQSGKEGKREGERNDKILPYTTAASSALQQQQQQLINNRIHFIYRTTNANRLTSKTVSACIYKKALLWGSAVSLSLSPPSPSPPCSWSDHRLTKRLTERRVDRRRSHRIAAHRIGSPRLVSYTWLNKMYGEILAWSRGGSSRGSEGRRSFGFSGFILGALMRFACIWSHSVDAYQRVSINCGDAY